MVHPTPDVVPLYDPDATGFSISREQYSALAYFYLLGEVVLLQEFKQEDTAPWLHKLSSYRGEMTPHMSLTTNDGQTGKRIGTVAFYADTKNSRWGIDKNTTFFVAPLTLKTAEFNPTDVAMLKRCMTMVVPAHRFFTNKKS